MLKKISILFFWLFTVLYSCTKSPPADYPSVQITSPYSLATFNVPCTIQVTGHASDSKSLISLSVCIANAQNIPVEQTIPITITSNNMNFSCSYSLNDIHLASGQYYVTVTASNGANIASAFQQIYVNALPVKRTAIYAITRNAEGVHVWKIDSVFHASLSYSVPGDYSSSDINSYYQQLYIAAHDSGNINVYSVPNAAPDWSLTGLSSPLPYFTNIYCNNNTEFISCYNPAFVKCYNHNGAIQSEFSIAQGYFPLKTFLWYTWLFVEEKSISSSQENLVSFYESTTAGYEQTVLTGSVVAMYGYDNNHIFVFGNNSDTPYMQLYNIQTNLFYSSVTIMPSAKMLAAIQINTNTYLLSFNNGKIYQYTYGANGIIPYLTGISASAMQYDSINNQIITAAGNVINEYNYGVNGATLVASATVSDSIRNLRVLYNK